MDNRKKEDKIKEGEEKKHVMPICKKVNIEDDNINNIKSPSVRFSKAVVFLKSLGPRIITGAADEDPSTIGTYSQASAQFSFGLLWLASFQYPVIV